MHFFPIFNDCWTIDRMSREYDILGDCTVFMFKTFTWHLKLYFIFFEGFEITTQKIQVETKDGEGFLRLTNNGNFQLRENCELEFTGTWETDPVENVTVCILLQLINREYTHITVN